MSTAVKSQTLLLGARHPTDFSASPQLRRPSNVEGQHSEPKTHLPQKSDMFPGHDASCNRSEFSACLTWASVTERLQRTYIHKQTRGRERERETERERENEKMRMPMLAGVCVQPF